MSALQELIDISKSVSNPAIEQWKTEGKKIVGFFCPYIPEEVLYAADVLPYRLRTPGCTETTSADVYMSNINCSLVRSCLQYILEGKYDLPDASPSVQAVSKLLQKIAL